MRGGGGIKINPVLMDEDGKTKDERVWERIHGKESHFAADISHGCAMTAPSAESTGSGVKSRGKTAALHGAPRNCTESLQHLR